MTQHHHPENDDSYASLSVNSGVAQPPSVNPYAARRPKRKPLPTAGELVEGILRGDITMLSRAVTLVESLSPVHQAIAQEVIEKCLPHSGRSRRIGITGVPGAGKSTSIDVFGLHVLRRGPGAVRHREELPHQAGGLRPLRGYQRLLEQRR